MFSILLDLVVLSETTHLQHSASQKHKRARVPQFVGSESFWRNSTDSWHIVFSLPSHPL